MFGQSSIWLLAALAFLDVTCAHKHPQKPQKDAQTPASPAEGSAGPAHPPGGPSKGSSGGSTCAVTAKGGGADDSEAILAAIQKCNNGGTVVFAKGSTYTIGTALNLNFLKNIELNVQGIIQFSTDTDYWKQHAFQQIFQNMTSFWNFGGTGVNVTGGGTFDGQGKVWHDLYSKNVMTQRPVLFSVNGLHESRIGPINLINSPAWVNFVADSSGVTYDGINIRTSGKNTDGWDTYRSSNINILNSVVYVGDDCVAFKGNSTDIRVENLECHDSHGVSVGSLGQYPEFFDIVENIYVHNVTFYNSTNAARIKTWPNEHTQMSKDLQGGGGAGRVHNVTWDHIEIVDGGAAIEITQCYGEKDQATCNAHPSLVTISDVRLNGFSGTVKKTKSAGDVICSSPKVCNDIIASNINVTSSKGRSSFNCVNVDTKAIGLDCVAPKAKKGTNGTEIWF